MNYSRLLCCLLLLSACDSKESVGGTAGDEGDETTTTSPASSTAPMTTSGGEGESEGTAGAVPNCESATTQQECEALRTGQDGCAWFETQIYPLSCDAPPTTSSVCVYQTFYGDGCVLNSCGGELLAVREVDGGIEAVVDSSLCGNDLEGFRTCSPPFEENSAPGCECVCDALGGPSGFTGTGTGGSDGTSTGG